MFAVRGRRHYRARLIRRRHSPPIIIWQVSSGVLACPHCQRELVVSEREARCVDGHSFDRAREGYFNLLVAGRRAPTTTAGDTAESLQARRRFLEAGHYQPISDAVGALVPAASGPTIDVGCGEGYYLSRISGRHRVGIDIAKTAVRMAASRHRQTTWIVGSSYRLPVLASSVGAVVSIFAQRPLDEFRRVLHDDGVAIMVSPAAGHLNELSALISDEESEKRTSRAVARSAPPITLGESLRLTYHLQLDAASGRDLLQMTPLYWQNKARARLSAGIEAVTVDVWVTRLSSGEISSVAPAQ